VSKERSLRNYKQDGGTDLPTRAHLQCVRY